MSPAPRRPAAVLLDMDGLLVDTEPVWFRVECEVVERLGGTWTEEHQHTLLGSSLPRAAAYMREVTGSDVRGEVIEGWLLDGMVDRLRAEPPALQPGAAGLLEALADAAWPCALVSSSYRVLVDSVCDALGHAGVPLPFGVTVAGDEVARRKPDPEPYLAAAAALRVDPARCVVLEDSPTGVQAGESAGCAVVAVPSLVPVRASRRRHVTSSLSNVSLALLARLVAERDERPA